MSITKKEIFQLLDSKGISYKKIDHEAVYTIKEMDHLGLENMESIAKNLFVRDDKKGQYFLLVLKKDKRLDLKLLQTKRNTRRLSFASEEDLNNILELAKGEVTPLGILNDHGHRVMVLIDVEFKGHDIGIHPNDNTATIWIQAEDLFYLIKQLGNSVEWAEF